MKKKIAIGFDIDGVITNYSNFKKRINGRIVERLTNLMYKFKPTKNIIDYFYKKEKPNLEMINLISKLKEDGIKIILITGFQGDRQLIIERLEQFNVKYDELYSLADRFNKNSNNRKDEIREYKIDLIRELGLEFYIDNRKDIIDLLSKNSIEIGIHYITGLKLKDIEEKIFKRIKEIRTIQESETTKEFSKLIQEIPNNEKEEAKERTEDKEDREWAQAIQERREGRVKREGKKLVQETQDESRQEVQNNKGEKRKKEEDEGKGEINREFKVR